MFCEIDSILFPHSCEVLEIVPSQLYVFPIFKCGHSSLHTSARRDGWRTLANEEIANINATITVFLRDPRSRFVSGVNTYLQHIKRDYPDLDERTVLWFVDNYLFLNRHYCPQFFWLLNLAKFAGSNVKLKLEHQSNLHTVTKFHSDARVKKPSTDFLQQIEKFDWKKLELYFYLDQLLIDRVGQEVSVAELVNIVKTQHPELYQLIFERTLNLVNHALPKT